jgi:hypothetical protein
MADGDLDAVIADVVDLADGIRTGTLAAFTDVGHVRRGLFGRFGTLRAYQRLSELLVNLKNEAS